MTSGQGKFCVMQVDAEYVQQAFAWCEEVLSNPRQHCNCPWALSSNSNHGVTR